MAAALHRRRGWTHVATSIVTLIFSAIACNTASCASAQQPPLTTTLATSPPHPTPQGHVAITQCPTAPSTYVFSNNQTDADGSAIDTLSVRFASESVARAPVVWYRLADALCVPHDALLIAAVRPADAAGEVRVDCARAPPAAECDVRARIRYALYLSEARPATLQAIGVEVLAPVTAATDALTIADTNGSTSSPTAAAAASQVQRGAGSDDDPLLIGAFAVVCVLAVAVAAALVVCAVWTFRGHFTTNEKPSSTSTTRQGGETVSIDFADSCVLTNVPPQGEVFSGATVALAEPVVILSTPQPALKGATTACGHHDNGNMSPFVLGSLTKADPAHDIFGFPICVVHDEPLPAPVAAEV